MDNTRVPTGTGHSKRQRIATREAARDAIIALFDQAQRNIIVFGPVLDGFYFNTSLAADALGRFVARHHENRARILVEDSLQVARDNARLVAMTRRFADAMHIRTVGEDHAGLRELFVVVDNRSYLHQEDLERLEGTAAFDAAADAMLLARRFHEMWDMSQSAVGINTVGL